MGKKIEEVRDFVEIYENTYQEKDKSWKLLGFSGLAPEIADTELLKAVIQFTLNSRSIFCIQSIWDWLDLADVFKGDPYQYRVNTPGTISSKNWSLRLPISLEELLNHRVNGQIRRIIKESGRLA